MKAWWFVVLACLTVVSRITLIFAQDRATITLSTVTLSTGESDTIDAYLDCGSTHCTTFAVTLRFDPAVVNVEQLEFGDYLGTSPVVVEQQVDNELGELQIAATELGSTNANEAGLLFSFSVVGISAGQTQLVASKLDVGDLQPLSVSVRGGIVVVTTPTPMPIETETLLPPTSNPAHQSSLVVRQPRSLQVGLQYADLWDGLSFQDITTPGIISYRKTVDSERTYAWLFTWCASGSASLARIVEPLIVEMRVDGREVTSVLEYSVPHCHGWMTLLSGWEKDQPVVLELIYHLSMPIFDGQKTYGAGDYIQRITVEVQ